jgi:transposase InsO family protein
MKCVWLDRGTTFINQEFQSFCWAQGISLETSAPRTPQQNGVGEGMKGTLKEHMKTLLAECQAHLSLWREALQSVVMQYNYGPVTARAKSPHEAFLGPGLQK